MKHPSPEALADYVAEPAAADPDLANHLEHCPSCAQDVTELRDLTILLSQHIQTPLPAPRPGVWAAIQRTLDEEDADTDSVAPRRPAQWMRQTSRFLQIAAVGVILGLFVGWLMWGQSNQLEPQPADPTVLASAILHDPATLGDQGRALVLQDGHNIALEITLQAPPRKGYLAIWLVDQTRDQRVQVGVLGAHQTSGHFTIANNLISAGFKIIEVSQVTKPGSSRSIVTKWARGELATKAPSTHPTKAADLPTPSPQDSLRPTPTHPGLGVSEKPDPSPSTTPSVSPSATTNIRPSHSPRSRPSASPQQPKRKQPRAQVKACRALLATPRTSDLTCTGRG